MSALALTPARFYIGMSILLLLTGAPLFAYGQENFLKKGLQDLALEAENSKLPNFQSPTAALQRAINFLLGLVGVLAVLSFIYGGAKLIVGFGNEEQAANAKKIILWSILGLLVVILAWVIITTIVAFIR